ncbi:hypothetical protein GRI33_14380 [Brucella sp. BO3]|uniref:hypothetical protein n=1 Tax=unclassified Brucella TaxID=2632610 RepID=UPI00084FADAC|nr:MULTISPECIES: hypothetical protein [unclassified Brucella]OEI83509.1 hypothetical protein BA060_10750 [Brucella sp. B13-0095]QMV28117.1 hypothetical protein GRI33_14380 [Brucella sp. BO3]
MTRNINRQGPQGGSLLDCYDELTTVKHLFSGASFIIDALIALPETESASAVITAGMIKLDEALRKLDSIRKSAS